MNIARASIASFTALLAVAACSSGGQAIPPVNGEYDAIRFRSFVELRDHAVNTFGFRYSIGGG